MPGVEGTAAGFGCAACYGEDADAVAAAHEAGGLMWERSIVDDVHFLVSLRRCGVCGQTFVSIFTEFIDWSGGDDAQYRDVVPVTAAEAATIVGQGEGVDLAFLGALGTDRRRLSSDCLTDNPPHARWATGPFWVRPGH
jgi:hypothetical protein